MRANTLMPIMTFMTRYYNSSSPFRRSFSVINFNLNVVRAAFFFLATFLLCSCEEDPTKIGYDLLPESDFVKVNSIDTLSIWSYSMFDGKARTDNSSLAFIGNIYNSHFGTTSSELITQVRFTPEWDHQPFTIDSVKLFLKLMSVKGTPGVVHSLRISPLTEQIYTDSAYYSTRQVQADTINGLVVELPALSPDSINFIVKTLPVEFGNKLVGDTSMFFYDNKISDYRSSSKGFYFQLLPSTDPLLVSLYVEPPVPRNEIHSGYHNFFIVYVHDASGLKEEYQFILDANNRNASYMKVNHRFDTGVPENRIQHVNDGFKDTLTYLQYLNGIYTKIVFPGLETIRNDDSYNNIAVNKATLTIPVQFDGTQFKASTAPAQLLLRYKTANGNKFHVPDYSVDEDNSFFGGKLDSVAKAYTFNIAGFFQKYLDDVENGIEPELEVFQPFSSTNSVILKANESRKPLNLEFIYTKFQSSPGR